MSSLHWLTKAQMERLNPFFPKSHGRAPVGPTRPQRHNILHCEGLRRSNSPKEHDPAKALYNRWKGRSDNGVFTRIMMAWPRHGLSTSRSRSPRPMSRRTARLKPVREKEGRGRQIGRTKDGMNTKLRAVVDAKGRPIGFYMSVGQVSSYTGATALLGSVPKAGWLLADRGYDANSFGEVERQLGKVRIPGMNPRKKAVIYDKRRYKRRNRIEIMFGRLKDWRRLATRYDRCPETLLSAIMLAAMLFWL